MWQTDIIVLEFTCWPPRQERLASSLPHLLFIKVSSPVFAHTHVFWWARYVMSLSLRSKRIVLCPCVDHVVVVAAAMREKCSSVSVRSPCTRMFASSRVDCYLVLPRFSLPPACFSCGLSFFFFSPYLPFDARRKSVAAALSSWNGYRSEICNYKLCISLRLDNDAVLASSVFFSAHPRSAAFQGVFGFVFFDLLFRGNRRSPFAVFVSW